MAMDVHNEFCDAVLAYIPRATPQEQEEIRRELCSHLEDHRDLLLEHGADETEAKVKAVEAMGTAEEIGRAWNEQLSPVWLWVGRICKVAFVLVMLCAIFPVVAQISGVWENLQVRTEVPESSRGPSGYQVFWEQELDIRQEFGEHIIRLHRVELGTIPNDENGEYYIQVHTLSYPKNPFHNAMNVDILMMGLHCNGVDCEGSGGGGSGPGFVRWMAGTYIEKDTPNVQVEFEHMGNRFYAEIPLDWGGAP